MAGVFLRNSQRRNHQRHPWSHGSAHQLNHNDQRDGLTDDSSLDEYSSQDESPIEFYRRQGKSVQSSISGVTESDVQSKFKSLLRAPTAPRIQDIEAQTGRTIALEKKTLGQQQQIEEPELQDHPPINISHVWDQSPARALPCVLLTLTSEKEGRRHMTWLHVQDAAPSLPKLKRHLEQVFERQFSSSANDILKSAELLIEKVRLQRERSYSSGSFLKPGAVHQGCESPMLDNPDDPCIFLNFPYFAIGDFESTDSKGRREGRGSLELKYSQFHPIRSLARYRFRSRPTKTVNERQAITSLRYNDVQECIWPQKPPERSGTKTKWIQKVYVPQLWALSIAGDMVVTNGPISRQDLRGQFVSITSDPKTHTPNIIEFIVQLDNGGKTSFMYPYKGCESYFGLENKKTRILGILRRRFTTSQEFKPETEVREPYQMHWKHGAASKIEQITVNNWIKILRHCVKHDDDRVTVHLRRAPRQIPKIQLDKTYLSKASDPNDDLARVNSPSQPTQSNIPVGAIDSPTYLDVPGNPPYHAHHKRSLSRGSGHASIVSQNRRLDSFEAFFTWPFEQDTKELDDRVAAWLDIVAINLVSKYPSRIEERLRDRFAEMSDDLEIEALPDFMPIVGCTREAVRSEFFPDKVAYPAADRPTDMQHTDTAPRVAGPSVQANRLSVITQTCWTDEKSSQAKQDVDPEMRKLYSRARTILEYFVPRSYMSDKIDDQTEHAVVLLYWGLFRQIFENAKAVPQSRLQLQLTSSHLSKLVEELSNLAEHAKELHQGSQRYKFNTDDGKSDLYAVERMGYARILVPITEAFEHLMDLLFTVSQYIHSMLHPELPLMPWEGSLQDNLEPARKKFKTARGLLIARAGDSALEKRLGPIVTPEMLILLLVERVSRGVHNTNTVAIIDIYDRIVERLESKVERHPSRHLLLEINRVFAELDIVLDVLMQQKRSLDAYGTQLDPQSLDSPTFRRHMRFPYERKLITHIKSEVEERIMDCNDLKIRMDQLADRNVKMVDTLQDEDNKTILLFTTITVIFLPLTFFTGYYGMNLKGIVDTTEGPGHFWYTAAPATAGVLVISISLTYWKHFLQRFRDLKAMMDI